MRLLIYGFGPYGHFTNNITEKILKNFPPRRGVTKVIFPVRFNRNQFLKVLERYRPDVVLGLGQCSRGRRLRIERRAINKRRERSGTKVKPIAPAGARWMKTNLGLTKSREARFSDDAGAYVCNYSMYVILNYLDCRRLPTRFGFIHVPTHYSVGKAKRFLTAATNRLLE